MESSLKIVNSGMWQINKEAVQKEIEALRGFQVPSSPEEPIKIT